MNDAGSGEWKWETHPVSCRLTQDTKKRMEDGGWKRRKEGGVGGGVGVLRRRRVEEDDEEEEGRGGGLWQRVEGREQTYTPFDEVVHIFQMSETYTTNERDIHNK